MRPRVTPAYTLAALLPALAAAQTAAPDAREIVRRAVEMDRRNVELARNYTYLERQEERQLDSAGGILSRTIRTWDVTLCEGTPYKRLVARNDQPLGPAEQQQEEEKLRRSIEDRRKEPAEQRARRLAEWERRRQKQREPLREVPDAFDFKLSGEEVLDGVAVYVIDALPRRDYKPKSSGAAILPKVRARFWIAKGDYQWAKMDLETLETVAFGGVVLRLGKGSHLVMEAARVNNEVWLPKSLDLQMSARVMLVKGLRREYRFAYSGYKKFQAESRVVE